MLSGNRNSHLGNKKDERLLALTAVGRLKRDLNFSDAVKTILQFTTTRENSNEPIIFQSNDDFL